MAHPRLHTSKRIILSSCMIIGSAVLIGASDRPNDSGRILVDVPKVWVDKEIAELEVPLANPAGSPQHISAEYYYSIPVRPIFRSYAVYTPGRGPAGYLANLRKEEPQVIWGVDSRGVEHAPPLITKADWLRAGEMVFDSAIVYDGITTAEDVQRPDWYSQTGVPLTHDGVMPYYRFVIRERGKLELGRLSCASCHTRVLPDQRVIKGAQGNFPFDRARSYAFRTGRFGLDLAHSLERALFAMPCLGADPSAKIDLMSLEEMATLHDTIPPGVLGRHRSSPFCPPQVPDLIGVEKRAFLDRSGLQRQNSIVDLMRYAALNQGMDDLADFCGFIPSAKDFKTRPEPGTQTRYSDAQLYALALYLYSLKPPPNPNPFSKLARQGQEIFQREHCAKCHTPPLFSNNKLTPAEGFNVPPEHKQRYDVLMTCVGTDPSLTLQTRRGTGYYKVPSLRGVWYRGPFEHSGSVATLEDWFDPKRLEADYQPTGFKGYGVKARPIPGHEYGLDLTPDEKRALIAYLKTL